MSHALRWCAPMAAAPSDYFAQQAFEDVVVRHRRRVLLTAYQITRNIDDAQDVAQHAFMQMYRRSSPLGDERSIERWLYIVTRNEALRVFRQRAVADASMLTCDENARRGLEETVLSNERAHEIRALIARLPVADRRVIELRYLLLMSTAEIADHLGVLPSRVKRDVQRAKWRLRHAILRNGLEVDV